MECEMYAWKNWLEENGKYIHDNGPELELYFSDNKIEYWLPIKEK
jgi:predicted transcriptional regulator YdeE